MIAVPGLIMEDYTLVLVDDDTTLASYTNPISNVISDINYRSKSTSIRRHLKSSLRRQVNKFSLVDLENASSKELSEFWLSHFEVGVAANPNIDPNHDAIERRVAELRRLADGSGDQFLEESAKNALEFCHKLSARVKPKLSLLADGTIRAFWNNKDRESLGILFLINCEFQYVALRRGRSGFLKTLGTEEDYGQLIERVQSIGLEKLWQRG